MFQISFDHFFECDFGAFEIAPVVIQVSGMDGADHLDKMQVIELPELDEVCPIRVLVILQGDPQIVVLAIVGKEKQVSAVL
jgi:hypothetical protein